MSSPIRTALERIDSWILRNNRSLAETLLPGASESELAPLRSLVAEIPDDLLTLLRWHAGQENTELSIQYNYHLMSVGAIVEQMTVATELVSVGDLSSSWWGPAWIPFLANVAGNCICVDALGSTGVGRGVVVRFVNDDELRVVGHASLKDWAQSFAQTLEEGLWAVEKDGGVQPVDHDALAARYRELNPGMPIDIYAE
jgi:cell wall assembly regulator SMI1